MICVPRLVDNMRMRPISNASNVSTVTCDVNAFVECGPHDLRWRQPDALNGLIQLGLAQLCQQHWSEAGATLRRATELKPDFAQAHYNLGYALSRSGDSAGAIQSYRAALRASPGDIGTHVALAEELLRSGAAAEGREHLDQALMLNPSDPRARQLRDRLGTKR